MISFSRCKKIALLSVILGTSIWIFQCSYVRKSDRDQFTAFKKNHHEINSSSKLVTKNTYQTRQGVRKDIWTADEGNARLHYRIESKSSLLKLVPGEHKAEMVENLQGIKCWMQDKLYYTANQEQPMQQMRYLEADQGTYRYNSQHFDANSVSIFIMNLAGHSLNFRAGPNDAFLRGIAQNVTFAIDDGTPTFQAKNFKASIKGSDL